MTSKLATSGKQFVSPYRALLAIASWAPAVTLGATLIALIVSMIVYGPALRAAAERQEAEEIAQENRFFCEKFGMDRGTEALTACAGHLREIRRREKERLNRDSGIL